ncbi:cell division protein SepF [Bifidobacterium bombi]|uniref:Cell division protein SepF n=1 Tax=Bifidobacterium bombi DSM 19703 TaxID=1341695 RepID=A0A080N5U9_9BIFI|nr:cell division protein SepF [Bifidobacterium bombi]KFF31019.1 hypothetical protein BBOMB_0349 [Bifidobacterium bombi DSM 19703]
MAGIMKHAMTYLGMADVVDDDGLEEDSESEEGRDEVDFDSDRSLTPIMDSQKGSSRDGDGGANNPFTTKLNRITTIHPKTYEDAEAVGRAIRDGIPVVLNLTGVSQELAYRIIDFSMGLIFGLRGSVERVTARVFLLSPAQVNIKVEQSDGLGSDEAIF